MKKVIQALGNKMTAAKFALVACVLMVAGQASAALPDWASGAGAELSGSIADFAGMVGPVIVGVAVAIVGIKLFKRFTNKI